MELGMNNFKNNGSNSDQKLYHFHFFFSQQLFWQEADERDDNRAFRVSRLLVYMGLGPYNGLLNEPTYFFLYHVPRHPKKNKLFLLV